MKTAERITRNKAIVALAKSGIAPKTIAQAYGLSDQTIYNVINAAKAKEEAQRVIIDARKIATKQWLLQTIQNNKRTHIQLSSVVKGLTSQILRLYEGEDAVELIDYIEGIVSNEYAFDYCRNASVITNYCEAKKETARNTLKITKINK